MTKISIKIYCGMLVIQSCIFFLLPLLVIPFNDEIIQLMMNETIIIWNSWKGIIILIIKCNLIVFCTNNVAGQPLLSQIPADWDGGICPGPGSGTLPSWHAKSATVTPSTPPHQHQ